MNTEQAIAELDRVAELRQQLNHHIEILQPEILSPHRSPPGAHLLAEDYAAGYAGPLVGGPGDAPRLAPTVVHDHHTRVPWVVLDGRDDRVTLNHAPELHRFLIANALEEAQERAEEDGGQLRVLVAHELEPQHHAGLHHLEVLPVEHAQSIIRSQPSTAQAEINLERGALTALRAKDAVRRLVTPRNMMIVGAAAGTLLVAAAIPALLAAAAAAAAVDPVVFLQYTEDGLTWESYPVTAWDW